MLNEGSDYVSVTAAQRQAKVYFNVLAVISNATPPLVVLKIMLIS